MNSDKSPRKPVPSEEALQWAEKIVSALHTNPGEGLLMTMQVARRLAKVIHRKEGIRLTAAQHVVAKWCGFPNWNAARAVFIANSADEETLHNLERSAFRKAEKMGLPCPVRAAQRLVQEGLSDAENARRSAWRAAEDRRREARVVHDAGFAGEVPSHGIQSTMSAFTPGDRPVDHMAAQVAFNLGGS